ncbi:MAG: hypothetical protein ACTS10_21535 [Kiloniellales bacterium]
MDREVFVTRMFGILGDPDPKAHYLYKDDVEKIIEDFKQKPVHFEAFADYCQKSIASPYEAVSEDQFEAELLSSINKYIDFGQSFYYDILEELMKRQGVPVDWSG